MEKLSAVNRSVAAAAGPRANFLLPADNDNLLAITLALAGEVATLYERLDTIERVAEQQLGLSRTMLEAFVASPDVQAERGRWHEAFVARLMRTLTHEVAVLKAQDGPPIPQKSGGD